MTTKNTAPTAGFGLNLLAREIAAKPGQNVVVSPLSVSVALAMTANGARGLTQSEIYTCLGLSGTDADANNKSYEALLAELKREKLGIKLEVANAIFARAGVAFHQEFLAGNKKSFDARVTELDFDSPAAVGEINDWVGEKTAKKITKLMESIDPSSIMFLVNAVYFKGEWSVKFDKSKTRDETFNLAGGASKTHPLMYRKGDMVYGREEGYEYISLPFGESEDVRLMAFLPNSGKSPADLASQFAGDTQSLGYALAGRWESEGELWLPKFDLEYEASLVESLEALGIKAAFSSGTADFSALRPTPPACFINQVKHKVVLKVDEDGAEGAAATSVGVGIESVPPPPFKLKFDRPFLALIADSKTQTVLFAACVEDPK